MPTTDIQNTARGMAIEVSVDPYGRGDMRHYRLEPPYVERLWGWSEGYELVVHEHVAVSAADLNFGSSETMIFPSDGTAVLELANLAVIPYKSHADALAAIGYSLPPLAIESERAREGDEAMTAVEAITARVSAAFVCLTEKVFTVHSSQMSVGYLTSRTAFDEDDAIEVSGDALVLLRGTQR